MQLLLLLFSASVYAGTFSTSAASTSVSDAEPEPTEEAVPTGEGPFHVTSGQQYSYDVGLSPGPIITFYPLTDKPKPNATEAGQFIDNAFEYAWTQESKSSLGDGSQYIPHGGQSWTYTNQPFKKGNTFTFSLTANGSQKIDWGTARYTALAIETFFSCQNATEGCLVGINQEIWTQFDFTLGSSGKGSLTF